MVKILLINPSSADVYKHAIVKSSVPNYIPINLLTLAADLLKNGHTVKVLDLKLYKNRKKKILEELKKFAPEYVGITFTTPLYNEALKNISLIKKYQPKIIIIAGGPHITADCLNTMKASQIDISILGEGDFKLSAIINSKNKGAIGGIAYRKGKEIIINKREPYIQDLDKIPFPSISLIDIYEYNVPYTMCKENPVFPLETSRGCVYGCVYCNKNIFGQTFRTKSVKRVIRDLKKIKQLGFKEVHIVDDGFTTNMPRAKEICSEIIKEKIYLLFACPNGIRADKVDFELLTLMKKAGFYRLAFGVESGSQKVLNNINKNLKLKDVERAFKLCREIGIESIAYFMFGLPNETEEDIKNTIKFAKKLKPTIAKFDLMIPLPSTPIYEEWKKKGYLRSYNWRDYGFYSNKQIYRHPSLPWEVLQKYVNSAYRSFYFSPGFMFRRFLQSLKERRILDDIKICFKSKIWKR